MVRFFLFTVLAFTLASPALARWQADRPDSHAPIGVMGSHTHSAGEIMVGYRYMYMEMGGQMVHHMGGHKHVMSMDMPMRMHMFGLMYAPSDDLTWMVMLPFVSQEMEHTMHMSGMAMTTSYTTESSGIGDIEVTALYTIARFDDQKIHLNLGVSFPTGSIDESDVTAASAPHETLLPYTMQPGSGTYDLHPGITWLGQAGAWSWGAQAKATIRLGENDRGYTLGNRLMATAWGARMFSPWFSMSTRLLAETWGDLEGMDPAVSGMGDMPMAMSMDMPMGDAMAADVGSGTRLSVGIGANFYVPEGSFSGLRFSLEVLFPVQQSLDGPQQMETDWTLVAGIQYSF